MTRCPSWNFVDTGADCAADAVDMSLLILQDNAYDRLIDIASMQ
jgi:hypothetical protein